jgi:hypothetical protein
LQTGSGVFRISIVEDDGANLHFLVLLKFIEWRLQFRTVKRDRVSLAETSPDQIHGGNR